MSVHRIRRVTLCYPWENNVMAKTQNGRHPYTNFPTTSLLDHIKVNCYVKIHYNTCTYIWKKITFRGWIWQKMRIFYSICTFVSTKVNSALYDMYKLCVHSMNYRQLDNQLEHIAKSICVSMATYLSSINHNVLSSCTVKSLILIQIHIICISITIAVVFNIFSVTCVLTMMLTRHRKWGMENKRHNIHDESCWTCLFWCTPTLY